MLARWVIAGILGVSTFAVARAGTGDPPPGKGPVPPSIFTRWLKPDKHGDEAEAAKIDKNLATGNVAPAAREPKLTGEAARKRDEANLVRRLAVCDQLKLIAVQNKDDALLSRAERLEQEVQAAYSRRAAGQLAGDAMAQATPLHDGAAKSGRSLRIDDRTIRIPAGEDKP